jgi:ribosomal protein S18 acetylase RimI-like enzyme
MICRRKERLRASSSTAASCASERFMHTAGMNVSPPAVVVREARTSSAGLKLHARVSIAFEVRGAWDPRTGAIRTIAPWTKDYDAGSPPTSWARQFDVSNWGLLSAWINGRQVGGAVLAWRTPGLDLLERREDRVVVWDLRVAPEQRSAGVGRVLWDACEAWARRREAVELLVETQDTNPRACRFYAARGCRLAAANDDVYLEFPDELQLLWVKPL